MNQRKAILAVKEWWEWLCGCRRQTLLVLGGLAMVFFAGHITTFQTMAERWSHDPQYSHGFLVPVFAAFVLLWRSDQVATVKLGSSWWGLAFLAAGLAMRLNAALMDFEPLDAFSILPTLAGLVLLLGGWGLLGWSWPAIAFLGFMMPLPFQIEIALGQPLRRLATLASTYVLQTLGYPAVAEGNIIHLEDLQLGVIDACSGLGMLVTFFALATALALVARAPLWDRLVIVVSAVPIALIANILRITATAAAHEGLGEEAGRIVMHDLAGWFMMPLALGLLWLELWLMSKLVVSDHSPDPIPLPLPVLGGGERTDPRPKSTPAPKPGGILVVPR